MKNLTIFRSEKCWKPNFELLNNNLSVPGKLGYAWKDLRDNNPFITVGSNHLITCEKQEKLLPAQVVEKELKARIDQIEKDRFDAEFTIRAGQCIALINELIAVLGEKGDEQ